MNRLGILGSTRGTVMVPLIHAIQEKKLKAKIEVVISNKQDAFILKRAEEYQIPHVFLNPQQTTHYDQEISALLHRYQVNVVVLIGYMKILSQEFVNEWRNQIINVHPSLLPDFAGGMDKNVHAAVLKSGKKETGCTVHFVTENVDAGPVLIQKKCPVLPNDTVETLKARVQQLEGEALIEAVNSFSEQST